MTRLTYVFLYLILCSAAAVAQQNTIKVEPGVSLNLAEYRKANIRNIQYNIGFNIPATKSDPIPANEVIFFEAGENAIPLQIDFKQDASHVNWIKINGKNAPVRLQQEHLVIEQYQKGNNKIEISFTAGNESLNRDQEFMYALFVPDHARSVFPCFDQPDLKAKYLLTLTVPKGWNALSNGALIDSVSGVDNITFRFANSDLLPTYLFSFTAGKYKVANGALNNRSASFFFRETDPKKIKLSVDTVFNLHANAIDFLEKWTSVKYPFQKIGFAAIPDFQFGGMEHPGAVQYKAANVFLDDAATKNMRIARISLISHETAHMWFGDLVTMSWFNDVWMKEVFANFMADKVTQKLMGTETFNLKFLQDHYPSAYGIDRTTGSNPIRQQLNNLQDAGSMYGDIIYHKAPIMMRQLELLMGEAQFQNGIREYLKNYAFGNAAWPDLIRILSKYTPADLNAWNKVWVNETGRPVFDANIQYNENRISKFKLTQKPESGSERLWPQAFEITLIYPDHEIKIPVNLTRKTLDVHTAIGLQKPSHIIFNSNGIGYGIFPIDKSFAAESLYAIKSPVLRASFYINAYENMLNAKGYSPTELIDLFEKGLKLEKEETNLRLICGYLNKIFWQFIPAAKRDQLVDNLERTLWEALQLQENANSKKHLFSAYQQIYKSELAGKQIYKIWQTKQPPKGVILTEDDYTAIALTLAVKSDTATNILQQQLQRINDPDRKKRLEFLAPALSVNVNERDKFFNSLKQRKGREKESWVATALGYLHHPLRQATSVKYIPESLNLLKEIQATGDIFFPQSFINASIGNYQSKEVADMVKVYIRENQDLNPFLLKKLKQGADDVFRSVALCYP